MIWTESEIDLARKLQLKGLETKASLRPQIGSCLLTKSPSPHLPLGDGIVLVTHESLPEKYTWLPSLDEALQICRTLHISFAQITDYIHRKRYADGREREGVYQLLLEVLR